jgi:hypothetical protein
MRGVPVFLCLVIVSLQVSVIASPAQVVGEDAEMARLRLKAEDAIANDDPDGAAMMMGRAALLAAQLAKKQTGFKAMVHKGSEALFRSQEHTYRAMALFRRAGGQLPASSGVCGSLALAHSSLHHALEPLADPSATSPSPPLLQEATALRESADNWATVVESMVVEYQCP